MPHLVTGIGIVSVAFLLTLVGVRSAGFLRSVDGIALGLITVLYGVMMFASSYVEEEQHYWYWMTSAWLVYLALAQ